MKNNSSKELDVLFNNLIPVNEINASFTGLFSDIAQSFADLPETARELMNSQLLKLYNSILKVVLCNDNFEKKYFIKRQKRLRKSVKITYKHFRKVSKLKNKYARKKYKIERLKIKKRLKNDFNLIKEKYKKDFF